MVSLNVLFVFGEIDFEAMKALSLVRINWLNFTRSYFTRYELVIYLKHCFVLCWNNI